LNIIDTINIIEEKIDVNEGKKELIVAQTDDQNEDKNY
jgi:hypothetical protein